MSKERSKSDKEKKEKKKTLYKYWDPPLRFDRKMQENRKIVSRMAAEGATQDDIAAFLGMNRSNISLTYRKEYNEGRLSIKMSLRQWQVIKAREGDTEMLKRLGVVYCEDQRNLTQEGLSKEELDENINNICGNSVQNKSTSSKTQPIDTISPSDQSDPESQ